MKKIIYTTLCLITFISMGCRNASAPDDTTTGGGSNTGGTGGGGGGGGGNDTLLAPTGITATVSSDTKIVVKWTSPTYKDSFSIVVEKKKHTDATYAEVDTVDSSDESLDVTGLTASTAYDFRLKSVAGSVISDYSGVVAATTNATPLNSLFPTATVTANVSTAGQIQIHTTYSNGNTNYISSLSYEYTYDGVTYHTAATIINSNMLATDMSPPAGEIRYRVKIHYTDGTYFWSPTSGIIVAELLTPTSFGGYRYMNGSTPYLSFSWAYGNAPSVMGGFYLRYTIHLVNGATSSGGLSISSVARTFSLQNATGSCSYVEWSILADATSGNSVLDSPYTAAVNIPCN
jgi:hypothetical protein